MDRRGKSKDSDLAKKGWFSNAFQCFPFFQEFNGNQPWGLLLDPVYSIFEIHDFFDFQKHIVFARFYKGF